MSERRACALVGVGRSTCRYRARRPADLALRERLRNLATERRRFGYRRLHVLLRREGHPINLKRIYRLYREEGLTVRRRRRRRRMPRGAPPARPIRPNERWSLDFVLDVLENGRRVRLLADRQELFLVRDSAALEGRAGDTVSLLPLTPEVRGVTTHGLLYRLEEATLRYERARGISNVLLEPPGRVALREGLLLVVHHDDEGAHQFYHDQPEI
jgi:hypothetical protein